MFFNKKTLMITKMFYIDDRFFESNRNFTTKHVKIVKIPGFLVIFVQIPGFSRFFSKFLKFQFFFCLNCQIPGFSR